MSPVYLKFLELAAVCTEWIKREKNHTSSEILFKGRYQSIFSKGDAAKMTNSLTANGRF